MARADVETMRSALFQPIRLAECGDDEECCYLPLRSRIIWDW